MLKDFINKWIIHNFHYKLLALLVSAVLWLIFTNINDPVRTYAYEIPVEILHREEFSEQGRYLEIEGTTDFDDLTVDVYLSARTSVQENLRSRVPSSFLRAYVDLYELDSDDNRLLIYYSITDMDIAQNAELSELRNKSYLSVDVEENIVTEIPVQYVITGQPEDGYLYIDNDPDIQITPSTITLTGPANQVEAIDHAKVTISVSGASGNINKTGRITTEDANGRTVTYSREAVRESATEVTVFIPIYTYKSVTLQPYLTGQAPAGYEYTGDISIDNSSVRIYGPESVVNKISSLRLPDIDLSNIRGEYEQTFDIAAILADTYGEGVVRLMEDSETTATVTFTVGEQETRTYEVYTEEIAVYGLGTEYELTFSSMTVSIPVYGLPEEFNGFSIANMNVTLRLKSSDLTEGAHTAALDVTGLGGLQCDGATVTFTLTKVNTEEDSSETANP